jgi:hypothetical protein
VVWIIITIALLVEITKGSFLGVVLEAILQGKGLILGPQDAPSTLSLDLPREKNPQKRNGPLPRNETTDLPVLWVVHPGRVRRVPELLNLETSITLSL